MENKDKESLSSCVKELTKLAERVVVWAKSIQSSRSYSAFNTMQLNSIVVSNRLQKLCVFMEANNLSALAARLEGEYDKLIKMTEYFDRLCKDPNHKDIKPGELETAPQELQFFSESFVSMLYEIANQIRSATEETIKPAEKQAEAEQNIAPTKRQRMWIGLKAFIKESYRLAMRSFFDSAMHK